MPRLGVEEVLLPAARNGGLRKADEERWLEWADSVMGHLAELAGADDVLSHPPTRRRVTSIAHWLRHNGTFVRSMATRDAALGSEALLAAGTEKFRQRTETVKRVVKREMDVFDTSVEKEKKKAKMQRTAEDAKAIVLMEMLAKNGNKLKCRKCERETVGVIAQQRRRADEAPTILATCSSCGHKWTS
jgi:DNA-directed RNA polymerase subunit M/transcription elongation factor TFIIS